MATCVADSVLAVLELVCEIAHTTANFLHENGTFRLVCVPKTLSVLIGGGNHVTSAHNDRAVMVLANVVRLAVEVEEPS